MFSETPRGARHAPWPRAPRGGPRAQLHRELVRLGLRGRETRDADQLPELERVKSRRVRIRETLTGRPSTPTAASASGRRRRAIRRRRCSVLAGTSNATAIAASGGPSGERCSGHATSSRRASAQTARTCCHGETGARRDARSVRPRARVTGVDDELLTREDREGGEVARALSARLTRGSAMFLIETSLRCHVGRLSNSGLTVIASGPTAHRAPHPSQAHPPMTASELDTLAENVSRPGSTLCARDWSSATNAIPRAGC